MIEVNIKSMKHMFYALERARTSIYRGQLATFDGHMTVNKNVNNT